MIALIIWFLMVLLVAIFGTELVMTTLQYSQVAPATQIPFWLPYLAVPLGALSMMIRLILQMIEISKKDYDKTGEATS